MIQDLVCTQEATIERYEEDCQTARREKEGLELNLNEAERKLKDVREQMQKTSDLNELDLKNLKENAERLALERHKQANQLEREKEQLQEQIQER